MAAALHGLAQMRDELVSGLGQIQTSPKGLDAVSAWGPGHRTALRGPGARGFGYPSLLLAAASPSRTACRELGWATSSGLVTG